MLCLRPTLPAALGLALSLAACHGATAPVAPAKASSAQAAAPAPAPAPETIPEPAPTVHPRDWWRAAEPSCPGGAELEARSLSYGRLLFCGDHDDRASRLLADDLGRIARCVHDAIGALQSEPDEGDLAGFLDRAVEAGIAPNLCGAVRRDAAKRVLTADRRPVLFDRAMRGEDLYDDGSAVLRMRYRFSCQTCSIAAETTFEVAVGAAGEP